MTICVRTFFMKSWLRPSSNDTMLSWITACSFLSSVSSCYNCTYTNHVWYCPIHHFRLFSSTFSIALHIKFEDFLNCIMVGTNILSKLKIYACQLQAKDICSYLPIFLSLFFKLLHFSFIFLSHFCLLFTPIFLLLIIHKGWLWDVLSITKWPTNKYMNNKVSRYITKSIGFITIMWRNNPIS